MVLDWILEVSGVAYKVQLQLLRKQGQLFEWLYFRSVSEVHVTESQGLNVHLIYKPGYVCLFSIIVLL